MLRLYVLLTLLGYAASTLWNAYRWGVTDRDTASRIGSAVALISAGLWIVYGAFLLASAA